MYEERARCTKDDERWRGGHWYYIIIIINSHTGTIQGFINKVNKTKVVFTKPSEMEDYLPNNSEQVASITTLMNISFHSLSAYSVLFFNWHVIDNCQVELYHGSKECSEWLLPNPKLLTSQRMWAPYFLLYSTYHLPIPPFTCFPFPIFPSLAFPSHPSLLLLPLPNLLLFMINCFISVCREHQQTHSPPSDGSHPSSSL